MKELLLEMALRYARNSLPRAAIFFQGKKMAGATGLEPATSAVTGQRSKPIELRPRFLRGSAKKYHRT